jgi:hypothetical protein
MKLPTTSILVQPRVSLLESEKAESLAESLEFPPGIEIVDRALWSSFVTPASKPKLTNPDEMKPSHFSRPGRLRDRTVLQTGP